MISVKEDFILRKRDKAFCKFLRKWFSGREYSDIEVAKNISSCLTHSLIDMEGIGTVAYKALEITDQSLWLNRFISGYATQEELKEIYYAKFGQYL